MVLTVGYWDLRGLGESIHLLLEYAGIEYQREIYKQSEGKDAVGNLKGPWLKAKSENTLHLDFPNLPYIIDGDIKISQSWALLKYVARKGGVCIPQSDDEALHCDIAEQAVFDVNTKFVMLCYSPAFGDMRGPFLAGLPMLLKDFERLLGERKWLTGDNLMYVDFRFAELLDHIELCYPNCYDDLPNVKKYKCTFEQLPKIAQYKESGRFKSWPINGARAAWGGENSTFK